MLTFLNSAILFGLAAVAIPILIHLFTRQKTKTIYFSSLKFLRELQKQRIRRLKIRQILLLILRTLLILALVFAFARPTLRTSSSSALSAGAQLTAVVILDNTLSMGRVSEGRRLLDFAKDRAVEIVSFMRQGDEIHLLYPQDPPKFAHEGARFSSESVIELIEQTELSYHRTDYVAALSLANHIMTSSQNINKEIYLICDLQKNGLNLPEESNGHTLLADGIRLFIVPVTSKETGGNLAISHLTIGNQILEKGKVAQVQVRIKNTTPNPVRNKLVHLFVNGKRLGQDVVNLEPRASANLVFRVVPDRTGFQEGHVLLEDDDLLEDNRRYFAFDIVDEIPVLIVGKEVRDTRYLKLALRPQQGVGSYIQVKEVLASQLEQEDLSRFKVVILSNVPKFSTQEVQKIQSFVKTGGGLLLFLGADVDLRNYNDHLHRRLNLPALTQTLTQSGQEKFLTLGKIDFSHPIFKGVFEGEKYVESPHVRFAVDISSEAPLDKIIEYSNGAPFLFEKHLQKGHILYVTTSISRDWSDLIFRGLFVPLLNRSVIYLSGAARAENDQLLVGDEISFHSESIAAAANLMMEKPDVSQVKIKPEVSKGNYSVHFGQTGRPGIHKLYENQNLIAQWAVNYDAQELEGSAFELETLAQEIDESQIFEIERSSDIAEMLNETRFGREFWKILAALALVFILLETALFKEKSLADSANPGGSNT